jgi:hypothetical protein
MSATTHTVLYGDATPEGREEFSDYYRAQHFAVLARRGYSTVFIRTDYTNGLSRLVGSE